MKCGEKLIIETPTSQLTHRKCPCWIKRCQKVSTSSDQKTQHQHVSSMQFSGSRTSRSKKPDPSLSSVLCCCEGKRTQLCGIIITLLFDVDSELSNTVPSLILCRLLSSRYGHDVVLRSLSVHTKDYDQYCCT